MHAAFATVANVTVPVVSDGEPEAELLAAMVGFTDAAEAWLSSGSLFFAYAEKGVTGQPARDALETYEARRLALNATVRTANSHLVAACELGPIRLYTIESSQSRSATSGYAKIS